MPTERCLEIDEPADLRIAEVLMAETRHKDRSKRLPNPVSALVLDFDGVMTDNRVLVFQDGSEGVLCDRSDGWGIGQLKGTGLPILILSTETNQVVKARADKLGIPCLHGIADKKTALEDWLNKSGLNAAQVVYVGNDENDLTCMSFVGCAVAVADARPSVIEFADFVLDSPGGHGAVREICDLIGEACR
jgi:N-acylneuraminate cytidylyltransferase